MADGGPVAADVPPNQTIYINNLNDKMGKKELKKALYAAFSPFGKILDVVARRDLKMRGQAFVVFEELTAAVAALRQMQQFTLFDKPMRIQFARGKSDAVAKADGSFVPHTKRKRADDDVDGGSKTTEPKRPAGPAAPPPSAAAAGGGGGGGGGGAVLRVENAPPNKTLFVRNLPPTVTEDDLKPLFSQFFGFVELRIPPGGKGVAFVEYTDEMNATPALQTLHNFQLTPTHALVVSYANK